MDNSLQLIPLANLALAFCPVALVLVVLYRWSVGGGTAVYALARMLGQLLMVGYVLGYIFNSSRPSIVCAVLCVMLIVASWISLRPIQQKRARTYFEALASISAVGLAILAVVTQGVLDLDPWYEARFVVPLAGMIFSVSMNTLSLAAERYESETGRGATYAEARQVALRAALIPLINSLFAVGLVSLPGMMTGQILSGVDPLMAARYQIMVMAMIFGSSGLSAICFLMLQSRRVVGT